MSKLNEEVHAALNELTERARTGDWAHLRDAYNLRDKVKAHLDAQPASPDVVAAARHYITLFSVASDIESLMMDVDEEGFEEALSGGGSEAWDRAHLQLIKALRDGRQSFHLLLRNRATLSTPEREA